jgi:hypothetical protein
MLRSTGEGSYGRLLEVQDVPEVEIPRVARDENGGEKCEASHHGSI